MNDRLKTIVDLEKYPIQNLNFPKIKDEARDIALAVPKNWWGIYTKGIDRSPLLKYLF